MDTLDIVLLGLLVLSLVLHAVKGKTATKADDVAADVVDATRDAVNKHYKK